MAKAKAKRRTPTRTQPPAGNTKRASTSGRYHRTTDRRVTAPAPR